MANRVEEIRGGTFHFNPIEQQYNGGDVCRFSCCVEFPVPSEMKFWDFALAAAEAANFEALGVLIGCGKLTETQIQECEKLRGKIAIQDMGCETIFRGFGWLTSDQMGLIINVVKNSIDRERADIQAESESKF